MDTDRSTRLGAYQGVKAITAELRGTKLHDAEAAVIDQAAEDLLLAADREDQQAQDSYAAFVTLMDDLLEHRWADNAPTAERVRELMLGCAPPVPAGAR